MHVFVYLALLMPLPAACCARLLAERLPPKPATWLLTGSAVVLAGATGVALAALTATVLGQIHALADLGHWSARTLRRDDPDARWIAILACVLFVLFLTGLVFAAVRRIRSFAHAVRLARRLPVTDGVAVRDDNAPRVYALPGFPGRIVVSTGMLDALDAREWEVVRAHEKAHLTGRHQLFVLIAQCAAAANPVLRPLATAVGYTVERWADEHAARETGDRGLVARTIGKAALLAAGHRRAHPMALGVGPAKPAKLGPVPRRVVALLAGQPRVHSPLLLAGFALLGVAAVSAVMVCRDLNALFNVAQAAYQ